MNIYRNKRKEGRLLILFVSDRICHHRFAFKTLIFVLQGCRYLFVRKLVKCLTRAESEDLRLSVVLMQVMGPKVASTSYCGVPISPKVRLFRPRLGNRFSPFYDGYLHGNNKLKFSILLFLQYMHCTEITAVYTVQCTLYVSYIQKVFCTYSAFARPTSEWGSFLVHHWNVSRIKDRIFPLLHYISSYYSGLMIMLTSVGTKNNPNCLLFIIKIWTPRNNADQVYDPMPFCNFLL